MLKPIVQLFLDELGHLQQLSEVWISPDIFRLFYFYYVNPFISGDVAEYENEDFLNNFDRIISIEMFEHMKNYGALLRKISGLELSHHPPQTIFDLLKSPQVVVSRREALRSHLHPQMETLSL